MRGTQRTCHGFVARWHNYKGWLRAPSGFFQTLDSSLVTDVLSSPMGAVKGTLSDIEPQVQPPPNRTHSGWHSSGGEWQIRLFELGRRIPSRREGRVADERRPSSPLSTMAFASSHFIQL